MDERKVIQLPATKDSGDGKIVKHCLLLDQHYCLLRQQDGVELVFSVNDRKEVGLQVTDANLKQTLYDALKVTESLPSENTLNAAIRIWKRETTRLAAPPEPFCFKSEEKLSYRRFDWEPTPGPCDAWLEFLARLSDPNAFMAFIGSCFDKESQSRQFIWLRGPAQSGKSKILGVLSDVFGNAAVGINGTHIKKDNRFFFSMLYGKRICLYPDCKNSKFPMTELVRNMTSGDVVPYEFKGQTPFSAPLYVKLFVASNRMPELTSDGADSSRIIYIEVKEAEIKDDPTWVKRLEEELPHFIFASQELYRKNCPHHGDIQIQKETAELVEHASAEFEDRFHDIFEENFVESFGTEILAGKVKEVLRRYLSNNQELGDFKEWLQREHKVTYHRGTKGRRYYKGMAFKSG